jgi:hypothetical protein
MKFARFDFLVAGVYGLLGTVPLFFTETQTGINFRPAINHPENYYGFLGLTAAWQVLFVIVSRDPVR